METKETNREEIRKKKTTQERRQRPDAAADRKKKAAKPAEKETARRKRTEDSKTRRQRPEEQKARRRTEEQRSRQSAQQRQRPAKPGQTADQSGDQVWRITDDRDTTQSASVQRPSRTNGVQYSAPQGTGPRKSAPQMSAQETANLRRQQRRQAAIQANQPNAEKKSALQNFISGVRGEPGSEAAAKAEQRRKERAARAEKKRKQAERNDTPAVIYTQPMAFSRDRLLIQLFTVTAVVAALVLGMSVFFKVKTITVAGAETYSAWAIREASGISEGDNLLTFSKPRASAKIQAELSYVDDVRIGIKLPDTVIIYIEEMAVTYAIQSTQGDWWLINSDGKVAEQIRSSEASSHTQVLGVELEDPQVGSAAVAADVVPQETLASGEPVPVSVSGAQRLASALQILKALEANDIVGQAASVDVTSLDDVTLWYGSRYEVLLGDTANMDYKIACMNDAILELSEYDSGILDISFENWTDQIGYTPFG